MASNNFTTMNIQGYPDNYNVYIGNILQSEVLYKYLNRASKIVIIYDSNLKNEHLPSLLQTLSGVKDKIFCLELVALEVNKNLNTIVSLIDQVLNLNIDKHTFLVAFGGGITGDIGGFIAAITLRGIPFINIPTTLLSAVDSAVGGKNGVDHEKGKNLIGTFYNPKAVFIDPALFSSLPVRQILSGFSEVIKYALIKDSDFFNFLLLHSHLLLQYDLGFFTSIIIKSLTIKKSLIEIDFFDNLQQRALLNLGHTFAHALEFINNYDSSLTHGEAVAIGLCLAAKFSLFLNLLTTETADKIIDFITHNNLPHSFPPLYHNPGLQLSLLQAMRNDKKNSNANINFILLHGIGDAVFVDYVTSQQILDFFNLEFNRC